MANLLASIVTAGNTLDVFQRALNVVQNNVANASTPGYARQAVNLQAQPLDVVGGGLAGGVSARGLTDSRSDYADDAVSREIQSFGRFDALKQSTSSIEALFDLNGSSSVSSTMDRMFQAFSAWSVTPNDVSAREQVLSSANAVASSIRSLAKSLTEMRGTLGKQIVSTATQINELAAQIRDYNIRAANAAQPDPGLDANVTAAVEGLSELAGISVLRQEDGTMTVLLDGGSPLVIGAEMYSISTDGERVLDWQQKDITGAMSGGRIGGLLEARNRIIPGLLGEGSEGGLNGFALDLANAVNGVLESGYTAVTSADVDGTPLFRVGDPPALTIDLDPEITPARLAAVDAGRNANGNAIALAALRTSASGPEGFGRIVSQLGREARAASGRAEAQEEVVARAKVLRDAISGVSLDAEAIDILRFQRAYQAAAQVVSVLNSLADATLNMMQR